jgi:hypothetical protein
MDVLTMRTRGRLGPNKPRRVSQNPQKKSPMVDRPPTDSPQDEVPANSVALSGITRRELFTRSGKIAVAAAVSSAFYPFTINGVNSFCECFEMESNALPSRRHSVTSSAMGGVSAVISLHLRLP